MRETLSPAQTTPAAIRATPMACQWGWPLSVRVGTLTSGGAEMTTMRAGSRIPGSESAVHIASEKKGSMRKVTGLVVALALILFRMMLVGSQAQSRYGDILIVNHFGTTIVEAYVSARGSADWGC